MNAMLTCSHCGAVQRASEPAPLVSSVDELLEPPLVPEALPTDSEIRVIDSTPDRLEFDFAIAPNSSIRVVLPLFAILFATVWYAALFFGFWKMHGGMMPVVQLIFKLPFLVAGMVPLGLGLLARWGRTRVTITPERFCCRWGIGPFGYSRHVSTRTIDEVSVTDGAGPGANRRVRHRGLSEGNISAQKVCLLRSGKKTLPLTLMQNEACSRQVASLIGTRLAELGYNLSHGCPAAGADGR